MPRPLRSFSQRLSDAEKREAISAVTPTERLLAMILVELMVMRGRRGLAELSRALERGGLSRAQAAALLDTSASTLRVVQHRESLPADEGSPS